MRSENLSAVEEGEDDMGTQSGILDVLAAIGSIATPIIVLIFSGIGWLIANRLERARELETKLREDRIQIYNDILAPYIFLFTKDEGLPRAREYKGKSSIEVGSEKVGSLDYKQTAFRLSLIGSDEVFRAFNNLMQFFYAGKLGQEERSEETTRELFELLGTLLLEIRKSVGNEKTDLHHFEMLEFLITDIRSKYQKDGKY